MKNISKRKLIAVILGNLILGIGITILRFSQMGNDPFCASTMAISGGLGMGLGTYQLILNAVLFVFQLIWGRKYIGLGTIINLFLLGYIVQFGTWTMETLFGADVVLTLPLKLVIMVAALVILTFGLAMYQVAELGVAPYDFLALGLADRFPVPYFALRVGTDAVCVLVILIAVGTGLIGWESSHLGIGTVITAFFLGPLVSYFSKLHEKWVNESR
ncbi:MAG: DUF6198 family protein [Lachnospiraceae bacterium]|nr:DUF6198 family protein [bacterium]MDY5517837.1 DUF6198 family protein [Lachnospiraceae bacterium]